MDALKIEFPGGFLLVTEKGDFHSYPGVYVEMYREHDDGTIESDLVAAVEYNTDENEIRTEAYEKGNAAPVSIISYETGADHTW